MICFKPITNRKGETFVIKLDYADAWLFNQYSYYIKRGNRSKGQPYAARVLNSRHSDGRRYSKTIFLHNDIMNHTPDGTRGKVVDHFDRDTLNNTRKNLRIVSQSVNLLNRERPASANIFYIRSKRFYQVYCRGKYIGGSIHYEKARHICDTYTKNITNGKKEQGKAEQVQ